MMHMMSELANSAQQTQHGFVHCLGVCTYFFCNLQQQPTCIKNIKSITCSGDPHLKYSIKFLIIKMRKRSFAIFRRMATLYKSDQLVAGRGVSYNFDSDT